MKKICLRCQREYADAVSFCYDDGEPLHPTLTADSRVCPKCETRYGTGAVKCGRDQIPVVKPGDLAFAQQRVCAECGRVSADGSAEFCGHDGARIVARWEVGLVERTAVPGELAAHSPVPIRAAPVRVVPIAGAPARFSGNSNDVSTARDANRAKPKVAKPPESEQAWSAPKHVVSIAAVKEPAPAAPQPPAPAPSAKQGKGGGSGTTGWFLSGPADSSARRSSLGAERPATRSAISRHSGGFDEEFGPTRVSRKLIAATLISALLCGGAFAYSRYAGSARAPAGPRALAIGAGEGIATQARAAGTATSGTATPTAPSAPRAPAATATPAPVAPSAAAPRLTPIPAPKVPPPAAAAPTRVEPRKKARGKPRAPKEADPTSALDAALRRATSTAPVREPSDAPAPPPQPAPPAVERPAPKKRLSRAEAERYFLDAAAEYKGGRPQEALRRFRIIETLGPRDGDLQGRVLLNLGHITEGLGNCKGASKYYQRAAKLVAPDARLRPDLEARLLRTKEACP